MIVLEVGLPGDQCLERQPTFELELTLTAFGVDGMLKGLWKFERESESAYSRQRDAVCDLTARV